MPIGGLYGTYHVLREPGNQKQPLTLCTVNTYKKVQAEQKDFKDWEPHFQLPEFDIVALETFHPKS